MKHTHKWGLLTFVAIFLLLTNAPGAHAADTSLGVTNITNVRSSAIADNTFENGWKWIFKITVPSSETLLQMKFADWTNGSVTIPVVGNMRFYSAQSTDASDTEHAAIVSASNTYDQTIHIDATQDMDNSVSGRQIEVAVESRVPAGTPNGSYGTSYGINTEADSSNPVDPEEPEQTVVGVQVSLGSDNPEAGVMVADETDISDEFTVLTFNIKNIHDANVDLNSLTMNVESASTSAENMIHRAILSFDGDQFAGDIDGNTITFTDLGSWIPGHQIKEGILSVSLTGQSGNYAAIDESLSFSLVGNTSNVNATDSSTGKVADVSGEAQGNGQTISMTGVEVEGSSTDSDVNILDTTDSSYGMYTIKFEVTAGDDDIYIPVGTATSTGEDINNTAGVVYTTDAAGAFTGISAAVLTSTADVDDDYFRIDSGATEAFTLSVSLDPSTSGYYAVQIMNVSFDTDTDSSTALAVFDVSDNADFETDPTYIPS